MTAHRGHLKDFFKFVIKHTKRGAGYGSLGEMFARHPHRVGVVSQVYHPSVGVVETGRSWGLLSQ